MTVKALPRNLEEEASERFVQRLQESWSSEDEAALESRLQQDAAYADAYRRVEQSWNALGKQSETPEFIGYREEALAFARRSSVRRWMRPASLTRGRWFAAVAATLGVLALALVWQLSPFGSSTNVFQTGIGEQRTVELLDHSRIALDARTLIRTRFSGDARIVDLEEGQAQFSVAHDVSRPFKVRVGDQTIIALGTVFTVEYVDRQVRVAMMEGRVAVVASQSANAQSGTRQFGVRDADNSAASSALTNGLDTALRSGAIELSAGEELRVGSNGRATVTPKADLEAATAWRAGKVVFRAETLAEAVRRVNRYSHLQIRIDDDALAAHPISGVFEAGDTQGFVNALQQYLPVSADYTDSTISLKSR